MTMPFGQRGRKPTYAVVDGELVIAKKLIKSGNGYAIILPREWLEAVNMAGEPTVFVLEYDIEKLTIRPHYGEVEMGVRV